MSKNNLITGFLIGWIGFLIGGWLGNLDTKNLRIQAIERGYMMYDYKTNQFYWKGIGSENDGHPYCR